MSRFNRAGFWSVLPALFMLVTLVGVVGCDDDDADDVDGREADTSAAAGMGSPGAEYGSPAEWGEHLVTTLGCNDCHSPKTMGPEGFGFDQSRLLSGHPADEVLPEHDPALVGMGPGKWILANNNFTAYVGPWGTSYAANLTPDPTGLGSWTEEQFLTAMKQGWYKGMEGTRKLLPPMPWQGYSQLSDDELKAIFAYLQSVPPVENAIPAAVMAGPPPGAAPGGEAPPAADTTTADTGA